MIDWRAKHRSNNNETRCNRASTRHKSVLIVYYISARFDIYATTTDSLKAAIVVMFFASYEITCMISRRNVRDKRNVGPPSRDRTGDLSCIPYFLVGFKEREDGEKRRKKKKAREKSYGHDDWSRRPANAPLNNNEEIYDRGRKREREGRRILPNAPIA